MHKKWMQWMGLGIYGVSNNVTIIFAATVINEVILVLSVIIEYRI